MLQNVAHRRVRQPLAREFAQRAAGAGENQPGRRVAARRLQALIDGAVLAVHGQQRAVQAFRLFRYQMPAGDQRFLVGQQHALAGVQRRQHRVQSRDAHHGAQRVVRAGDHERPRRGVFAEEPLDAAQIVRNLLRFDDQPAGARTERSRQLEQPLRVGARAETAGGETVGVAREDVQRLRADGAGRAQNGNVSNHARFTRPNRRSRDAKIFRS